MVDKQRISNQKVKEYLKEKVPRETYAVLEATHNFLILPACVLAHCPLNASFAVIKLQKLARIMT
ncbi:MAG TPA: hypothetical protein G4N92_03760 [Anaerolineae bacterium]|nr:hypothetical protein [Anaerolineae bacterium]